MGWLDDVEAEFRRVMPGENPGRTRTIARRAAGIAVQEWSGIRSADMLQQLRSLQDAPQIPEDVRAAADRLTTRLDANFHSPSSDPIADARCIVEFVRRRAGP